MFEVRIRWLMYRKATYDKTEDNPPKAEPWVDEDDYTLHEEGWIKFYPRLTAIVSYKRHLFDKVWSKYHCALDGVHHLTSLGYIWGDTHFGFWHKRQFN